MIADSETGQDQSTSRWRRIGPGLLVTAAFIGPGTVVTASQAGAQFGCQLLWAILLAVVAAIVLQILAARLGILCEHGLGEEIRLRLGSSRWLAVAMAMIIGAIGIGNCAYQTGNLTGAAAGLQQALGGNATAWVVMLTVTTGSMILFGNFPFLRACLIAMVVLLSGVFLLSGWLAMPATDRLLAAATEPQVTRANLNSVLALLGTTVVPYNLFLHASSAAQNWRHVDRRLALSESLWDTIISIGLGGLVTAAIVLTANAAFFEQGRELQGTQAIAEQLRPLLGPSSSLLFAVGLFAAGMTSSLTAPLATAYAICGVMGWTSSLRSSTFREPRLGLPVESSVAVGGTLQTAVSRVLKRIRRLAAWPLAEADGLFRLIALGVVILGGGLALLFGKSPTQTIVFAQVANALLLPIVALFVVVLGTQGWRRQHPLPSWFTVLAWVVYLGISALVAIRLFSA